MSAEEALPLTAPAAEPTGPVSARRRAPPLGLVVPALVVAAAVLLPLVYLIIRALGGERPPLDLLARPRTVEVIVASIGLASAVTAASVAVAVPLAWLLVRSDLPGRKGWTVALSAPLVVPSYVSAYALVAALGPRGALQAALEPFGVERLPEIYGFGGATLALTLATYPYVLLAARGALLGADPALEEAGRSLGLGPWAVFGRVTVPLLRPAIAAGALLAALYALSDFGAVSLLQFDSFTRQIYTQYRASFDRSLAALLGLLLVGLTVVILAAEWRLRGSGPLHRAGTVRGRSRPVQLGAWRWPALGLCAGVTGLALALPLGTVLFWLARAIATGEPVRLVLDAAANSVLVSTVTAAIALVVGLPVAVLAARHPHPISLLLERATYLGYALPGIVVALALVFIGANYLPWLYQTLPMLVLAYLVRFVPQAVGSARAALLLVSPRLEEAARTLGRSHWRAVGEVVVPAIRPGLLAGAALVFLTTMKELPATLLLAPIGFDTLATRIWSATAEGFFTRAAGPALLMIGVSLVSLAVLLRVDDRSS